VRKGILKTTATAAFAVFAITAASGAVEASAGTISAKPASVTLPAGYKWKIYGTYMSAQGCLDQGALVLAMGLATSYYCVKNSGLSHTLFIYTQF
jgi:hypothetical protein